MSIGKIIVFAVLFLYVMLLPDFARAKSNHFQLLKDPYLGQAPPGNIPQVFMPGIVSTKEYVEFSNSISPDGKEFYFARRINKKDVQMVVRWENGAALQAEEAAFLKAAGGFEPHVSADGSKIYFTRFAPPPAGLAEDKNLSPQDMEAQMVNIWMMERSGSGWGEPEFCVNGMYVSTSDSGTIYTTDIRSTSVGICRFTPVNDSYSEREPLQGGVNSPAPGAHPCIAPDESYIVFDSKRSQDPENADLYVCFKLKNGNWSEACSLGSNVNSKLNDICPSLSPDGKYLFYMSQGDIYWVSTEIIAALKPKGDL
jgi:Tol biopolymer transport system component